MPNNPSQGLNLGGQPGAYGDTFSALNLFHGADAWIMQGANGQEVRGAVTTDAQGWATELPVVDGVAQTIWANVFYTKILPPGDYIVEWTGEGTILPWQDYEVIGPNKFKVAFGADYSGGDDGITLRIEATDPKNTGDYIRDIKIYHERHADLVAMGERFDPEWFQAIDGFRVLRTHDWQGTNFSQVTDWTTNDETADQAFWVKDGRGMPYELLVETANQSRSDLWINIPHMATDQYMREAAAYVKANLDKDLRVYVEYTNEYWTTGFDQHQFLIDKGASQFGNVAFANAQAYGARASEMTAIFKEVFAEEGGRLYPTVTLNHGAFSTAEAITMLTTPAYVAQGGVSPLDAGIRFLSTDGYFSWFNTDPATDAMIDGWMAEADGGFGSARDFLIAQIRSELSPAWAAGKVLADQYGLTFGVYEGGALLLNGTYEAPGAPRFTAFNEAVQIAPEMRAVYEVALAEWRATGNGPFAWYSDTGRWGPWGDYGLWNAPFFTPEPRTEAIIDANETVEPWFTGDLRPASAFDNGTYDAGTAGVDAMTGTALADRLYGLAGNDTMNGLGGNDWLVGGLGTDTLSGGNGRDLLVGGGGGDVINGGAEIDLASYRTSLAGVVADLQTGRGSGGDARGDRFTGIEGLVGGQGGDMLGGDGARNWLKGGGGDDTLSGGGGADTLDGGAGTDTATYAGAGARVKAALDGSIIQEGDAAGDVFKSIARLTGTDFGDVLVGNGLGNALFGGASNDTLKGQAGNDSLYGGRGADALTGGAGSDRFNFTALADGGDVIRDFSNAAGNDDSLRFTGAIFGGLAAGALAANRFAANTSGLATTADHRFIYETDTGTLRFDSNGTGAGGVTAVATLTGAPTLTVADIVII